MCLDHSRQWMYCLCEMSHFLHISASIMCIWAQKSLFCWIWLFQGRKCVVNSSGSKLGSEGVRVTSSTGWRGSFEQHLEPSTPGKQFDVLAVVVDSCYSFACFICLSGDARGCIFVECATVTRELSPDSDYQHMMFEYPSPESYHLGAMNNKYS